LKERSLLRGSIQLSTGQESAFYFDCKRVTLSCRGAKLIGDAFFSVIKSLPEKTYAIGGSGLGGASIVTAIQLCALERGVSYEGFYVRAEPKKHGTRKWLENEPPTGSKVAVVDDVVTSGRSVLHTVEKATEHGCEVVAVITLVDRCQGGADAIRKHVPEYRAIFTRADFSDALQLEQSNASA
jgi:orotate phosphoribosyltransferase